MALLWLGCGVLGCGNKKSQAAVARPKSAPTMPVPAETAAGPTAEGEGFVLKASVDAPLRVGKPGVVTVAVETRAPWHVNKEFPWQIDASGPAALKFSKPTLHKADAKEFGEQRARFEVPLVATGAGKATTKLQVSFAVCTEENCVPDERTLALVLDVQP